MPIPTQKGSELSDKLALTGNVDDLMRLAVVEMITRYRADAAILLVAPGSNEATCWAGTAAGLPDLLIPGLPAKIEPNDLTGRALVSGAVQTAQEPGLGAQPLTILVIPIKSGESLAGLVRLSSDRLNIADPPSLALFETIAGYIGENLVRLQSPASPPTTETATSTTTPTHVVPSSETRKLCERVYHGVAGLMVCDRFFVALDDQIVYQVENGLELPSAPVLSSDKEMIAYVKRQRSGILVTDVEREMRFRMVSGADAQARSLVCVPLASSGNVVGVMAVSSRRAKSYSDVELKMLTVVADLMAMVLQYIQK